MGNFMWGAEAIQSYGLIDIIFFSQLKMSLQLVTKTAMHAYARWRPNSVHPGALVLGC